MLRNTIQNQILKTVFDTVADDKKISEETFLEIKTYIKILAEEAIKIQSSEMALYQKIKSAIPKTALEMPKEEIIDTQNQNNNTLLICACINGHSEMVTKLIEAKASLNIKNEDGDTALICAARHGFHGIVNELLAAKAKLELVNNEENTALDEAIHYNKLATVSVLLHYHAIIRNPEKLYEFLKECDPRDLDVLSSLEELCKKGSKAPQEYLEKLKILEELMLQRKDPERKETSDTIQGAIDSMPTVLVDMITSYRHFSLSTLPFFKATEIDIILNKVKAGDSINSLGFEHKEQNKKYVKINNLITALQEIGIDYLKAHPVNPDNQKAAEMLSKVFSNFNGMYVEEYLQQKLLESLENIFSIAKSDLLKTAIKKALKTYEPFSHFDFTGDFLMISYSIK